MFVLLLLLCANGSPAEQSHSLRHYWLKANHHRGEIEWPPHSVWPKRIYIESFTTFNVITLKIHNMERNKPLMGEKGGGEDEDSKG